MPEQVTRKSLRGGQEAGHGSWSLLRPALLGGDLLLYHPCFDITNNHLASYLSLLIIFPSTSYPPMPSLTRVDKRPFAKNTNTQEMCFVAFSFFG